MSDPVNTDALKDLARAAGGGANGLWGAWDDGTARLLRSAAIEIDDLRAVIENAPHNRTCPASVWNDWMLDVPRPCTCWKADAL